MEEKFVKICPKCGSVEITIPPAGLDLRMSLPDYCSDCNNIGIFPEIKISEIKSFKDNLKK